MRKYLAVILLSMSALVITSCANAGQQPPDTEDTGAKTDQVTDQKTEEKPSANKEPLATKEEGIEVGIAPGMLAPDFTLLGRDGKEVSLSDYRGKITFLNFWATTCPYCIDEMPDLEEFHNAHKDEEDFALLGINMTKTWEKQSKESLIQWLDDEGLTFPVVFDEEGLQAVEWSARSLPVTFIIDPEGISLGAIMGKTDMKTLERVLTEVRAAQ